MVGSRPLQRGRRPRGCVDIDQSGVKNFRGVSKYQETCLLLNVVCVVRKTVSIAHGGRSDLVQHANTEAHKQEVCASSAASISKFFVKAKPTTDTN